MEEKIPDKRTIWYQVIRILLWFFVSLIALLIILVLALNIPAVQTFIAGKFIKSLREKTDTEISLSSLKIALPNTVNINELFLKDKNADTMLYLHSLNVDVSLFGLLKNEVAIKSLSLENVVANIHRKNTESAFNFQFLVDLFLPDTNVKSDTVVKPGKPWLIKVNDVSLQHIRATFYDAREGTDMKIDLGDFNATFKDIDLNKKKIDINEILLKNTSVLIALSPARGEKDIQAELTKSIDSIPYDNNDQPVSSVFLDLDISADKLTIVNTSFRLDNTSSPRLPEGIDYAHMDFRNINAGIRNIYIDKEGYRAEFKTLSVSESCGLNLKMLTADARFTNKKAELKNLNLETSNSKIVGEMSLTYSSFNGFLSDLWNSETTLNLENSSVNANEVLLFVPFLASDPYISKLKNTEILVSAKADGKINDLNIENLELALLDRTILKSNCRLRGIPDFNSLVFDATVERFTTTLKDICKFVDPTVFAGLKFPPAFELSGHATGKINSMKGDIELKSAYGNIIADAFYQSYGNARRDTFSIDFAAQNILAGTILADSMLGKSNFTGYASGSGISNRKISGSAHLDIHDAHYNSYTYKNVTIDGKMTANGISATASSPDSNLNFKLSADADLREAKQKFTAKLDLVKANLHALNFGEKDISVSTNLIAEANYTGLQNADAHIKLVNTMITGPEKTLPVRSIEIQAGSTPDSLKVMINSDLMDGIISANIAPENLGKTFQSAYRKYFGLADTNQVNPGRHLAFFMDVHIPEDILKMVSPDFELLNISKLEGEYKSDNNELSVELQLPDVLYSGIRLDSFNLAVKGKNESLTMDMSLETLSYDTLKIENIRVREQIDNGILLSHISTLDTAGKENYLFANQIETSDDYYKIRFLPKGLVLDGSPWNVDEGNFLGIHKGKLSAEQFVFSKDRQSIGILTGSENQKLVFENFAMENLINIVRFSGGNRLLKGNLHGEVVFPAFGTRKYINADIAVKELYFQDSLVGDLFFVIKTENDRMEVETRFENNQNKILVTGDVDHLSGIPLLNLKALVDINNLNRFERLSLGYLSQMHGKIDGEISVKGTTKKPEIEGFIGFEETGFKVNSLNFLAKIKQEKILIDQTGAHFIDFVIEDEQAKKLVVDGDILSTGFTGFGFDLHLKTKDLLVVNSTVADNPVFYGKLTLDADVNLKGDTKNPKLTADVKVNSSTDLTYALPGSELQLVTSEGIVQFLDFSQMNDSLFTARQGEYLTDSILSQLTGVDIALNLEIDPEAKFTVDIDPKSGDFLNVSGGAKLSIIADASGKQSITGIYEVKKGVYQLSFYGLVKKTFTIAPGSTVSWSGKPMDADLDITAEYEVRTSSVSLVANETAEMSDAEKQTFNKRLPYMVKLNLNGFLAEPEISFNIDLPEKYMLTYPLVATKLALLNSEENKADLNKQVFALLVTGSFMADNPLSSNSSSPTNIASTAARNSVNGILADQLNNVSGKYITGVDVNFGLTSYEDFENASGDIRTEMDIQVSKKLFNDRITVEAMGSFDLEGEKSNSTTSTSKKMTNEFAVIYQLSESGEYKLRAYYEDAYDLFDGDISYSGIALIFEKEFDTLKRKKK